MRQYAGQAASLIIGFLLLVFGIFYQELPVGNDIREWLRILSNAALLPGVLLTGFGIIARISGEGLFDGIKYGISSLFTNLRGGKKRYASYYDYMHREKKKRGANPLMFPGILFLGAAVILTAVYHLIG